MCCFFIDHSVVLNTTWVGDHTLGISAKKNWELLQNFTMPGELSPVMAMATEYWLYMQWVVVKSWKFKHFLVIFWPMQWIVCVACDCYGTGEGHRLLIDFKAYKEKLLREELDIADLNDPARIVTLVFHARVLGMSGFLSTMTTACWAFSVTDLMVGCQRLPRCCLKKN